MRRCGNTDFQKPSGSYARMTGKKHWVGNDWQDVLSIILLKQSPTSYIQKTRTVKKESDFRYQFAAQSSSLSRRIYKKWGVGMAELHRLETIYLVCLDKNEIISKVNKEQQELLKKIQVSLEMC